MYHQDLCSFGKYYRHTKIKISKIKRSVPSYIRFLNYFKCMISPRLKLYSPLISPVLYTELKQ